MALHSSFTYLYCSSLGSVDSFIVLIILVLFRYAAYTIDEVNEKTKAFRESAKKTPVIKSSGIDVIDVSKL